MSTNTSSHHSTKDKDYFGRRKKTLDDYEFILNENARGKTSELGKGSYGSVKKVQDKETGDICALKIISKRSIFEFSTKENLKREISIQRSITHPNIISLVAYFEDRENVYLVLEYAENGTLFQHLRKQRRLSEKEAFVYFLQTCLGIDYLHKRKILHRDLKPENLLLDKANNIKLCDFGWSAENHTKRHTFCGTVDYMAPEMVKNQPYDHRLDIWCLGILLYELLHGYAPFKGKNDREKCDNIAQCTPFDFNSEVSYEARELINQILRPRPADRVSMDEIFRHPWMRNFEKVFDTNIQDLIRQQDDLVMQAQQENGSRTDVGGHEKNTGSIDNIKDEDSQPQQSSSSRRPKKAATGSLKHLDTEEDHYHKKETDYLKKPSMDTTADGSLNPHATYGDGHSQFNTSALMEDQLSKMREKLLYEDNNPFRAKKVEKYDDYYEVQQRKAKEEDMASKGVAVQYADEVGKIGQEEANNYLQKMIKLEKKRIDTTLDLEYSVEHELASGYSYGYQNDKHKHHADVSFGNKHERPITQEEQEAIGNPRIVNYSQKNALLSNKLSGASKNKHGKFNHEADEPNFFQRILIGLGCISRDNREE